MPDSEFGFELAPDIAEAEREAVSTAPNSALQRAIRSTQSPEGFRTPTQLLTMGPNSFKIAAAGEKNRRDMLVGRAQQGITLTGQAISQRGVQRKTDTRRFQEEQAKAFYERTRGMDPSEALAEVNTSEQHNELILRGFDMLDAAKIKQGEAKATLRGQGVEAAAFDKDQAVASKRLENSNNAKRLQGVADEFANSDPSSRFNTSYVMAKGGIASPAVIKAVHQKRLEDPKGAREFFGNLGAASAVLNKASTEGYESESFKEALGSSLLAWSAGELSEDHEIRVASEMVKAEKAITEAAADRTQSRDSYNSLLAAAKQASLTPDGGNGERLVKAAMDRVERLQGLATRKGANGRSITDPDIEKRLEEATDNLNSLLKGVGRLPLQTGGAFKRSGAALSRASTAVAEGLPELAPEQLQEEAKKIVDELEKEAPAHEGGNIPAENTPPTSVPLDQTNVTYVP